MRKFILCLLLSTMSFFAISVSAEKNASELDFQEIKQMHSQMLELVQNGEEEKIEDLELVQKYRSLFTKNPKLLQEYLSNIDVTDEIKVKEKLEQANNNIEITVSSNTVGVIDENIIVMDDGSFFQTKSEIIRLDNLDDSTIQPLVTNYFGSYRNVHQVKFWALMYPDPIFQLNTDYDLSRNGIKITNTSKAGTWAIFPYSISPVTTRIVVPEAKRSRTYARAIGEYTLNGLGTNGVAIIVLNKELSTTLNLSYVDAQQVVYTITHNYYDQ